MRGHRHTLLAEAHGKEIFGSFVFSRDMKYPPGNLYETAVWELQVQFAQLLFRLKGYHNK